MELNEHTTSTIESQPIEDDLTLSPSTPFARSQVMFFERLKPQSQAAGVHGDGGGPSPASKVRKLHENGQDHQDILSNGSLMVDGSRYGHRRFLYAGRGIPFLERII